MFWLYNWMTTANGYLRLAILKFPQAHRPSTLFDAKKRNRLERIVDFVASVNAPMFLRIHLKARASDDPENVKFLRDLLSSFNQQDQTLVCEAIKKCFLKLATQHPSIQFQSVFFSLPKVAGYPSSPPRSLSHLPSICIIEYH